MTPISALVALGLLVWSIGGFFWATQWGLWNCRPYWLSAAVTIVLGGPLLWGLAAVWWWTDHHRCDDDT